MPLYKRPPVTEAVIDVHVEGVLDEAVLTKVQKSFLQKYPFSLQNQTIGFELTENAAKINQALGGYQMRSTDNTEVLILTPNAIATSRHPPYDGWPSLLAAAQDNWRQWRKLNGQKRVTRIGVRYVNRIDIPSPEGAPVDLEQYLNIGARVPPMGLTLTNFNFHMQASTPEFPCKMLINIGSVPSPLVKTVSFLLDLDFIREGDLPQADEPLWELIGQFRGYKNRVFEACVTEKARSLFNA